GLLGIAEVEAVREADGLAAGARHVEGGAVDGASAREIGVALAGRWPVERDGEAPQRRSQPQDGRVQARAAYGPRADEVVVLLEYPSLRLVVCRVDPRAAAPARCDALDLVARALLGQEPGRDRREQLPARVTAELAGVGDGPDLGARQLPALADAGH